MSRTDKDMSYELRLEDELAPRASGRNRGNVEIYRSRRWTKSYEVKDMPEDALVVWYREDGKQLALVFRMHMREPRRTYDSNYVSDAKHKARRNERRTQKHYLAQSYSSIDYDVDIVTEFELGTKAQGLYNWWW